MSQPEPRRHTGATPEYAVHVSIARNAAMLATSMLRNAGIEEERTRVALGSGIRPYLLTLGAEHGWRGKILALPAIAPSAGAATTAVRLCGIKSAAHWPVGAPDKAQCDELAMVLESVEVPADWLSEGTRASAHRVGHALASGGITAKGVCAQGVKHNDRRGAEPWRAETELRNKYETACAVLGRGHAACAGRFAVKAGLNAALGDWGGLNESARTHLGQPGRRYALGHRVRWDWIAIWREWLESFAHPSTLRIVSGLAGATRLDTGQLPLGMAILRMESGGAQAQSRRARFSCKYPLWTSGWLLGAGDADRSITGGNRERDIFATLLESWGHREAQSTDANAARQLGRHQTVHMLRGHRTPQLSWGHARSLVESALDVEAQHMPRSRKAWALHDALTSLTAEKNHGSNGRERRETMRAGHRTIHRFVDEGTYPKAIDAVEAMLKCTEKFRQWIARTLREATGRNLPEGTIVSEALGNLQGETIRAVNQAMGDPAKAARMLRRSQGMSNHAERAGTLVRFSAESPTWVSPPAPPGARALTSYRAIAEEGNRYGHCLSTNGAAMLLETRSALMHAYHVGQCGEHAGFTVVTVEGIDDEGCRRPISERDVGYDEQATSWTPAMSKASEDLIAHLNATRESGEYDFAEALQARQDAALVLNAVEQWARTEAERTLWRSLGKILPVLRKHESPDAWATMAIEKAPPDQRKGPGWPGTHDNT